MDLCRWARAAMLPSLHDIWQAWCTQESVTDESIALPGHIACECLLGSLC